MGENGEDNYYINNFNYNKTHNQLDKHVSLATFAMFVGLLGIPFFTMASYTLEFVPTLYAEAYPLAPGTSKVAVSPMP